MKRHVLLAQATWFRELHALDEEARLGLTCFMCRSTQLTLLLMDVYLFCPQLVQLRKRRKEGHRKCHQMMLG